MNDRQDGVNVTTKHSRSVTLLSPSPVIPVGADLPRRTFKPLNERICHESTYRFCEGVVAESHAGSGLDHRLLELVKIRTSRLNGCAYWIDMHSKDARTIAFSRSSDERRSAPRGDWKRGCATPRTPRN